MNVNEGIANIISSITTRNNDELQRLLDNLLLTNMSKPDTESFLFNTLTVAYKEYNKDACVMIMDKWNETFPEQHYLLGYTVVISLDFEELFYQWFVQIFPEIDLQTYISSLIKYIGDTEADIVVRRLDSVFGPQQPLIYQNIIDELETAYTEYDIDLSYLIGLIKDLLSKVNVEADQPFDKLLDTNEINNSDLVDLLDAVADCPFSMTPCKVAMIVQEALDYAEEYENTGNEKEIEVEQTNVKMNKLTPYKNLTITLCELSIKELNEYVEITGEQFNEEDEISMFRILGPSFPPITHTEYDENNPCKQYGGCRMFTCWEALNIDEDGSLLYEDLSYAYHLEWYTGVCDYCAKKIYQNKKHCAVRAPIPGGSWIGCFCSWQCVKDSTDDAEVEKLAEYFERMYKDWGIYDRVWNDRTLQEDLEYVEDIDNEDLKDMMNTAGETEIVFLKDREV